jgi:hypothetical protein
MPPFLYRHPNTGYRVQGFTAEEVLGKDTDAVVTVMRLQTPQLKWAARLG